MPAALRFQISALTLMLCVLPACSAAAPVPLRLCTADTPFYPFTMPDGSGRAQRLLKQVLAAEPVQLLHRVAPRARCLKEAREGRVDALIGVFSVERKRWLAYPMDGSDSRADPARALDQGRFLVYRRRAETAANWDGQVFHGLAGRPVGVRLGFEYGERLKQAGAAIDDQANSSKQLLQKLARGRMPLAIEQEEQAARVLQAQQQDLAPLIEALPQPFSSFDLYLILTRDFQQRHPALCERLWQGIARLRQSAPRRGLR